MSEIELAEKYLPYVDEEFTQESKISLLTNQDFKFTGANSVKVYKVSTSNMNDYGRRYKGGGQYGPVEELSATTEEFILRNDRSFTFVIDALDEDETEESLEAASALARQIREKVIPEVDTNCYKKMTQNAGIKPSPIILTDENIYEEILKANCALDDALVPETGRVLTVTPSVYLLMKKCKDITMNTEIGNDMRIKGVIGNIDGDIVIKIPSTRLPEDFGFMLAHPCATVAPVKLASYKTHTNPPGINGTLTEGRICYDAFVLENKAKAIYYQAQPVEPETE